jgi:hypothetical protein
MGQRDTRAEDEHPPLADGPSAAAAGPELHELLRHAPDGTLAGAPGSARDQQRLLIALQRSAGNAAVNRLLRAMAPPSVGTRALARRPDGGFVVADGATPGAGQMSVGGFLDALGPQLHAVAEAGLGSASLGCPWIDHWIGYYRERSPGELAQAIDRYAPEAAGAATAADCIAAIRDRVAAGIAEWKQSGSLAAAASPPPVAFKRDGSSGPAPAPDPAAVATQLGPGRPLDVGVRTRMATAMGADFGAVRVHDDADAARLTRSFGARAMTVGEHLAFADNQFEPGTPVGDALIAHELAHVVQQQGGPAPAAGPDGARLEADADSAAIHAVEVLHGGAPAGRGLRRALRTGLRLQRCNGDTATAKDAGTAKAPAPKPAPAPLFDAAGAGSQAAAHGVIESYKKLGAADRRKQFDAAYKGKLLGPVLKALGAEEASFKYADEVRELLVWVQEEETRAYSGKSDADMAKAQATWLYAKNQAAAAAAAKAAGKVAPPTAADIEAERKAEEAARSFHKPMATTRYDAMAAIPGKQKSWDDRAAKAITKMVAYATSHHPETKVTAASLVWDPNAIDSNAPGAFAQGRGPGTASVGFEFVIAVEANPAYAMSTVVHELYGHPEYDSPENYHARLIKQAIPLMPGSSSTGSEGTSYGYHESEIYSLLREHPYWTKTSKADAKKFPKVAEVNYDPAAVGVAGQITDIVSEWEPTLAAALLHGLYKRFEMDPRIRASALAAFSAEIQKALPADHAKIAK